MVYATAPEGQVLVGVPTEVEGVGFVEESFVAVSRTEDREHKFTAGNLHARNLEVLPGVAFGRDLDGRCVPEQLLDGQFDELRVSLYFFKLLGMLDRRLEVTLRGSGRSPALFADWEGVLQRGDPIEHGEVAGWDAEALQLSVGDVRLTLHPDQFVDAIWTARPLGGWLKLVIRSVELDSHSERRSKRGRADPQQRRAPCGGGSP